MDKIFVMDKKYFVMDKIILSRTNLIFSRTKNILSGQMDRALGSFQRLAKSLKSFGNEVIKVKFLLTELNIKTLMRNFGQFYERA